MSAALSSGAPVVGSRDRESGMPRAFVVRRSSVKSVARGDDDTDSLFAVSTLTSGVRVNWTVVGSRMAIRQRAGTWKRPANLRLMRPLSARTQRLLQG